MMNIQTLITTTPKFFKAQHHANPDVLNREVIAAMLLSIVTAPDAPQRIQSIADICPPSHWRAQFTDSRGRTYLVHGNAISLNLVRILN